MPLYIDIPLAPDGNAYNDGKQFLLGTQLETIGLSIIRLKSNGNLEASEFIEEIGSGYKFSGTYVKSEEFIEEPTLGVQMRFKDNKIYTKGELIEV